MNDLEKYLDRVIGEKSADSEAPHIPMRVPGTNMVEPEDGVEPTLNIGAALFRRWGVILLTFVVLCAAGIPALWLLVDQSYVVHGTIKIDPIIPNILTGEDGGMSNSNYTIFMNSQAMMITSPVVVMEVAKDLSNKELEFFRIRSNTLGAKLAKKLGRKYIKPDVEKVLKEAILDKLITVAPARRGDYIIVSMTWPNAEESKRIVDSFVRSYMVLEGTHASDREEGQLTVLQAEQKVLALKLANYRSDINVMAKEFGTKKLAGRYDMKMVVVGQLLKELMAVQAKRIAMQVRVNLLNDPNEEFVAPEQWVGLREEYIEKDSSVRAYTTSVIALEQALIQARQYMAEGNPNIKLQEELLVLRKISLEEQKEKVGVQFDDLLDKRRTSESKKMVIDHEKALEQVLAHEAEIQKMLAKEDRETIDLGQKNLAIQELEEQHLLAKEMFDRISRRIQEVKMEQKRPASIRVSSSADIFEILDKRPKYTAALAFGALALGVMLALLKEKSDYSLRTPDDVAKRIGLRLIGTTTSTRTVKPARLREQVVGDYQAIRANLGLLDGAGMPKRLVVTSPGMREGKTTFAANLAISTSKSGKKVLLIDGDLRNPSIASLLGLPKGAKGLLDVLLGQELGEFMYSVNGLDILAADSSNISDAFELLVAAVTPQRLNEIGRNYDHVIIDTPPVLAFADALIWAKVADGVILTCFAGQTTGPNLAKAKQRLVQMDANVLGTVLSSVELDDGYHPYGYHYYTRGSRSRTKRVRKKMLLPMKPPDSNLN